MRAPAKTFVRARRLRRALTQPEVKLWAALRALDPAAAPRFRRQHPIGPYILDFYAPAAKLAVEIDGAAHDLPAQIAHDTARTAWLTARSIRLLRVPAPDILDPHRRDDAISTILAARCPVLPFCIAHPEWLDQRDRLAEQSCQRLANVIRRP